MRHVGLPGLLEKAANAVRAMVRARQPPASHTRLPPGSPCRPRRPPPPPPLPPVAWHRLCTEALMPHAPAYAEKGYIRCAHDLCSAPPKQTRAHQVHAVLCQRDMPSCVSQRRTGALYVQVGQAWGTCRALPARAQAMPARSPDREPQRVTAPTSSTMSPVTLADTYAPPLTGKETALLESGVVSSSYAHSLCWLSFWRDLDKNATFVCLNGIVELQSGLSLHTIHSMQASNQFCKHDVL